MPLKKSASKPAFKANLKKEIASGKPLKQSLAIAFSVKRAAGKVPEPRKLGEKGKPLMKPGKKC